MGKANPEAMSNALDNVLCECRVGVGFELFSPDISIQRGGNVTEVIRKNGG